MVKSVGVTGTRKGLTRAQVETAWEELRTQRLNGATELHHGAAVGADMDVAARAQVAGFRLVAHPVRAGRSPLERNREIVAASDVLYAFPKGQRQELRSGTWATVRAAVNSGVPVVVVWPDGRVAAWPERGKERVR